MLRRAEHHTITKTDKNHEAIKEIYFVDYKNKFTYSAKEYELDNFAAALLMPKELVYKTWQKTQRIRDFAEAMGVSQGAAAIRLTELNLID